MKWYEHKPSGEARPFRFGEASEGCEVVDFAALGARIKRASQALPAVASTSEERVSVESIAPEAQASASPEQQEPAAPAAELAGGAANDHDVEAPAADTMATTAEAEHAQEQRAQLEQLEQLEAAHWEQFAEAFDAHRAETLKQAASWIREVTLAVTQHIVGEAVREDAAAAVAAVERALEVLNGFGHATVHVHPRAVRAVERALYDTRGMDSDAVQVLPDVSVAYGNAHIATDGGGAEIDVAERTKLLVDAALESVTRHRITASQPAASPAPARSSARLRSTGTGEPVR